MGQEADVMAQAAKFSADSTMFDTGCVASLEIAAKSSEAQFHVLCLRLGSHGLRFCFGFYRKLQLK